MWFLTRDVLLVALSHISFTWAASLVLHDIPLRNGRERRLEQDVLLPMRVGLMQNTLAQSNAEKWLMNVSDPDSPNYGHFWTQDEVIEAFKPSEECIRNFTSCPHGQSNA